MFGKLVIVALVAVLGWGAFARTSNGSGRADIYVVKPADTLWSIAVDHYGGDPRDAVYELERRNHLTSTTIRPGQRLILP
jgi:LysM repeat protein